VGDFSRRLVWRLNVLVIVSLIGLASSPKLISYTAINLHPADKNLFVIVAASGFAAGFVFPRIKWLASLDTWLHEYAHAVTAASLGGRPSKIRLAKDMSGLTNFTFRSNWRFRAVLVSAAGPLASIVTLVVATRMALAGTSRFFLLMVFAIILSVLITTVRSGFGWFVGILAALATGLCVAADGGHIPLLHTSNASLILLAVSVSSAAGVGMREAIRRFRWDSADGDEGKIAAAMHVPEKLVDFLITCIHLVGLWLVYLAVNDLAIDWVQLANSLDLQTIWKSVTGWLHQVAPTIFAGNSLSVSVRI
jgi:hypothetical protein